MAKNQREIPKVTQTGFQSPANDYLEHEIDLNAQLIRSPSSTFVFRSRLCESYPAGIYKGDVFLVDRALTPIQDDLVVVARFGELTVKRVTIRQGQISLGDCHEDHSAPMAGSEDATIWGVVTHVIHATRKGHSA